MEGNDHGSDIVSHFRKGNITVKYQTNGRSRRRTIASKAFRNEVVRNDVIRPLPILAKEYGCKWTHVYRLMSDLRRDGFVLEPIDKDAARRNKKNYIGEWKVIERPTTKPSGSNGTQPHDEPVTVVDEPATVFPALPPMKVAPEPQSDVTLRDVYDKLSELVNLVRSVWS